MKNRRYRHQVEIRLQICYTGLDHSIGYVLPALEPRYSWMMVHDPAWWKQQEAGSANVSPRNTSRMMDSLSIV
ncbi:unnamed protein product [Absidia cylindrospora]